MRDIEARITHSAATLSPPRASVATQSINCSRMAETGISGNCMLNGRAMLPGVIGMENKTCSVGTSD